MGCKTLIDGYIKAQRQPSLQVVQFVQLLHLPITIEKDATTVTNETELPVVNDKRK